MENENSIIGIKINETNIPAKCIMVIKKYQDLPISEVKQKIEDNQYILTCDYTNYYGSIMKCSNTKLFKTWYYFFVTLLLPT